MAIESRVMGCCVEKSRIKGFLTPPPIRTRNGCAPVVPQSENSHLYHKLPAGNSPYVKAKRVQVVDRNPGKAVSMFWAAINAGDRVESALKDMAIVMKQLGRSDEAIEAIKSFRYLCPLGSQESLDNILIELFKKSGRMIDLIHTLQDKIKSIENGIAFNGKRTKIGRSQGKRIQMTIEKEYSRLLGNLAWAFLELEDYKPAEEAYRKALSVEPDKNKMCNLAVCLIHLNRTAEATLVLHSVKALCNNRQKEESHAKSYERASEILDDIEFQRNVKPLEKQGSDRPLDLPTTPFTQPRRCLWPPRGDERVKASDCENWRKLLPEEAAANSRHIPRKTVQDELSPSGISKSLKQLSLGDGVKSSARKKSWAKRVEEEELSSGDENCDANILPETPVILKSMNLIRKKRWADMVEEEENVLPGTPMVWKDDGYHTQPERKNRLQIFQDPTP